MLALLLVTSGCESTHVTTAPQDLSSFAQSAQKLREGDVIRIAFPASPNLDAQQTIRLTAAAGHPPVFLWVKLVDEFFIPEVDKRLAAAGYAENKDEQGRMIVPAEYEAPLKQLLLVINYEYHVLLNFRLSGEKVFNFSDKLITLLAQTSSNVKCEYVVAPFPASIFVTKSVVAINLLYSFLRGEAAGDPAVQRAGVEYDIPLTVFVLELPPGRLSHPSIAFYVFQGDVRKQAAMTKRVLYLNPEWSVEQALKTDWAAVENGKGLSSAYPRLAPDTDEQFYSDGLAFFRVLINMVLYVTSADPDLIPGAPARIEKSEWERLSTKEKTTLKKAAANASALAARTQDAGFNLAPIVIEGPNDGSGATSVPTGRHVRTRFKVHAFWRNQRIGPGRTQVRRTLVREHMRGPELADLVNRQYDVREPRSKG